MTWTRTRALSKSVSARCFTLLVPLLLLGCYFWLCSSTATGSLQMQTYHQGSNPRALYAFKSLVKYVFQCQSLPAAAAMQCSYATPVLCHTSSFTQASVAAVSTSCKCMSAAPNFVAGIALLVGLSAASIHLHGESLGGLQHTTAELQRLPACI